MLPSEPNLREFGLLYGRLERLNLLAKIAHVLNLRLGQIFFAARLAF